MHERSRLELTLPLSALAVFHPLLQQGVWLPAQVGCSVMSMLTEQLGVQADYVIDRITTLFLNGKAIDELEETFVPDGATLALSSAMPGLVGTTMRRGGHLAAMRGDITCQTRDQGPIAAGRVRIKLFNMVMTELGAVILSRGIILSKQDLWTFFQDRSDRFWSLLEDPRLNGMSLENTGLKSGEAMADVLAEVMLVTKFRE